MFAFILSTVGANAIVQLYKKSLATYGSTKIHVALAIVSLAISAIVLAFGNTETFKMIMDYAIALFASALTTYEVIFKKLSSAGISDSDLST